MDIERNFWVVGGDLRQVRLAELLENDGHTVHTAALEQGFPEKTTKSTPMDAARAHCVILPLPVTTPEGNLHAPLSPKKYRLEEILNVLRPGQILCGGMISGEVKTQTEKRGLRLYDYYAREECMIANAVPVALALLPLEI